MIKIRATITIINIDKYFFDGEKSIFLQLRIPFYSLGLN